MRLVQEADLKDKRVFLRVDFNVPLKDGVITDNNRIKAAIPTIKYLVQGHAKIIIGTHCGRPEGKSSPGTSIMPMAKELQRLLNLKVTMAPGLVGESIQKITEAMQPGGILVLENLRWDSCEEQNDSLFAQELAKLADLYVNDAFAVSHRANASVEAITNYLPSYAGLLLQKEVESLSVLNNPSRPFVVVIGGVKIEDKAAMVKNLEPKASEILLGGGVANTFLKAKGIDIGSSVYDEKMVDFCKEMLEKHEKKLILPVDFVKDCEGVDFHIYDIGAQTREIFEEKIKKAKTVFWNGNLGYTENKKFCNGSKAIAKSISELEGTTVVAGGDTAGFVINEGLDKSISFISTGGGAALEFLAGERLPGIEALN
jgi:phosphoglycerate kinase